MKTLKTMLLSVGFMLVLTTNAFAASFYKAGNIAIGGGYTTSSHNITGTGIGSGLMGQISYLLMDDFSIGVQYYSGSFSDNFFGNIGETIVDVNIGSHMAFNDNFGLYVKLGYGSNTLTFPAPTQSTSGSSIITELGLESKFSPNIIGFIGINILSANNPTINPALVKGRYTNLGLDAGLNFVF